MITAKYSRLGMWLLINALFKPQLRASFNTVNLRIAESARTITTDVPLIFMANHSSWWDGHLVALMNALVFHREGYTMMEDTQLARYQFFRYAGCFSVNRADGRSAAESISYATRCLLAHNRALLIFPQGEILANDARPLVFYNGMARLIKPLARAACVPVAIRLEFIGEAKPDAFVSAGAPVFVDGETRAGKYAIQQTTARLEVALACELDALCEPLRARKFESFQTVLTGRPSINRLWDAVRGKPQIRPLGPAKNETHAV